MNLKDYRDKIMMPFLLKEIKEGRLDSAIQSEDCQDIINNDIELKEAVAIRLEMLNKE